MVKSNKQQNKVDANYIILVTGGGGYVGCHTVLQLLERGYTVVVMDNLTNCHSEDGNRPESLKMVEKLLGKKVAFYAGDVRDKRGLKEIFDNHKIDCVIHLAGLHSQQRSFRVPLKYYENDMSGAFNLLESMRDYGVKNIVCSSSADIYGPPEYLPVTEKHHTSHKYLNPWVKSKLIIEEVLQDLCNSDKSWKVIVLRYYEPVGAHESGLIGPDCAEPVNNILTNMARNVAKGGGKFYICNDEVQGQKDAPHRDYVHITDIGRGHVKAVENILGQTSYNGCKVYNLGSGQGIKIEDVIAKFSEVAGVIMKYEILSLNIGEFSCYASGKLAEKELGWKMNNDMADVCRDILKWIAENSKG